MDKLNFRITGVNPLLLNNPRSVDPFDKYSVLKKEYTSKKKKTEEDLLAIRQLDIESKVYWDDAIGIYVPQTWIIAAIAGVSWNLCKIKKADIRAAVFPTESRIKLRYKGEQNVKQVEDVTHNPNHSHVMLLKQGQVKIAKAAPIFHDWSFDASVEFDKSKVTKSELISMLESAANYGGFGDFRPTYGRAELEVLN